jgi:hypothetical protein
MAEPLMPLHALLFSSDASLKKTFGSLFETASIRVFTAGSWVEALNQIKHHRIDALVVDSEVEPDALDLFATLRKGKRSRNAIGFAVTRDGFMAKKAYASGANFAWVRPVQQDVVARTLRAALGLILTERRRYHRHHLNLPAKLLLANGEELAVEIVNLSESGAALEMKHEHHRTADGQVRLRFKVPTSTTPIEASGVVNWTDGGRIGIEFGKMRTTHRTLLHQWLTKKAEHAPIFKNAPNAIRALAARA